MAAIAMRERATPDARESARRIQEKAPEICAVLCTQYAIDSAISCRGTGKRRLFNISSLAKGATQERIR